MFGFSLRLAKQNKEEVIKREERVGI